MKQYKDMLGREIKVGDYIAFPTCMGHSGVIKIGKVVELTWSLESYGGNGKTPIIKAQSVDTAWNRVEPQTKLSRIAFFDRAMVLPKDALTEEVLMAIEKTGKKE